MYGMGEGMHGVTADKLIQNIWFTAIFASVGGIIQTGLAKIILAPFQALAAPFTIGARFAAISGRTQLGFILTRIGQRITAVPKGLLDFVTNPLGKVVEKVGEKTAAGRTLTAMSEFYEEAVKEPTFGIGVGALASNMGMNPEQAAKFADFLVEFDIEGGSSNARADLRQRAGIAFQSLDIDITTETGNHNLEILQRLAPDVQRPGDGAAPDEISAYKQD
ncbi:MAG: hypothetical protein AAB267_01125, partial [Candidatus Desantisbacteria bacterium]